MHCVVNPTDWPIAITPLDEFTTAGVRLWRQRQQIFATIAVKSTFSLAPDATMTQRAPLPIETTEHPAKGGGIEPGDLAPALVQPEIWLHGHAWFPPAEGAHFIRARLSMARDSTILLRKTVEIPIDASGPPFLHAMAPLAHSWPIRTRLLGNIPLEQLDRSPLDLPDIFDWNYFQAAPSDQRLGPLRGDEWIRLEGIHPMIPRFDTRLPSAWCAVALFGTVEPFLQGVGVQMGLDSIQIDADHGVCALVFRGHLVLPTHIPLDQLEFVSAVALPNRPMPKLAPQRRISSPPPMPPMAHTPSLGDTVALDPSWIQTPIPQSPIPIESAARFPSSIPPAAPRHEERRNDTPGKTLVLDQVMLDAATHREITPFHEATFATQKPPFAAKSPSTPRPSGQTMQLDVATMESTAHRDVLPFHEPAVANVATATNPAHDEAPARTAPVEKPAPMEVPAVETANQTLGEAFLAAMADGKPGDETNIRPAQ